MIQSYPLLWQLPLVVPTKSVQCQLTHVLQMLEFAVAAVCRHSSPKIFPSCHARQTVVQGQLTYLQKCHSKHL